MENSASVQIPQEANSSKKNEITQILERSRTPSGNGNENEQLVIELKSTVQTSEIVESNGCRICKVPIHIRKRNSEAYTPQSISIGPYHHKMKFSTTEDIKRHYSQSFMRRAVDDINLENLETTIRKMEDIIRHCYVDSFELEGDDFVTMIVLDVTFILELFLRNPTEDFASDDPIVPGGWLYARVRQELLLLENQIPFFVIKKLYHLACPSLSNYYSLMRLTFEFFADLNIHQKDPDGEIKHFTDLLRFFALPPLDHLPWRERRVRFPRYSATHLRLAGVKFVVDPTKFVLDLSFKGGVLEIPVLDFKDDTEALVLNILALELCCHTEDGYITDFYLILGRLIETDMDVKLLSEVGIICNSLGNDSVITSMVKNFTRGIHSCNMNSNLSRVCEELNGFCDDPWNRWKVLLRRRYWGAISASAIILLLLTLLQTVCSVIQTLPILRSL